MYAQLQEMRAFLDGQLAVAGHLHAELDALHNTFLTEFVGLLPAKIGLLLEREKFTLDSLSSPSVRAYVDVLRRLRVECGAMQIETDVDQFVIVDW